jgi:hypothetical protein
MSVPRAPLAALALLLSVAALTAAAPPAGAAPVCRSPHGMLGCGVALPPPR